MRKKPLHLNGRNISDAGTLNSPGEEYRRGGQTVDKLQKASQSFAALAAK